MSDANITLQLYRNPTMIQSRILDHFQNKLLGENESVVEGNNPFTFLLEMAATTTSGAVLEACEEFRSLYPKRANKASDLYKHMSDYDYVDLFATPAISALNLYFEQEYLINNAVAVNDNYKKIIIPEYSTFKIGEYTFGIPYPIEIQVRTTVSSTGEKRSNFNIIWDTTIPNPLMPLQNNTLNFYQITQEGLNLLAISVPVYQFKTTNYFEDTITDLGFAKKYTFTSKFYAARVFHYRNNAWNELHTSMSDSVFDQTKPTAQIKVLPDTNEVVVIIPQVYFSNNQIGNRVLIKLYTTEGTIDLDILQYTPDQFSASFLIEDELIDDKYSAMLKVIPVLQVASAANRITGGSDGLDFESWRDRVIYNTSSSLLVSPADITAFFDRHQFKVTPYQDNITRRIYLAQKTLTDPRGIIIAAADLQTRFSEATFRQLDGTYSGIKHITDNTFLVLPSVVYRYDASLSACVPLTDEELQTIHNLPIKERVAVLNNTQYSFSPYHLKVSTSDKLPLAGSYDLMHPYFDNVLFAYQNPNISTQVALFGLHIEHLLAGTGGYRIKLTLHKSDDLLNIPVVADDNTHNIKVLMRTTSGYGGTMFQIGNYLGLSSTGRPIVAFDIATEYRLADDHTLDTSSFTDESGSTVALTIPLDSSIEFMFFVRPEVLQADTPMFGVPVGDIPDELSEYIYVLKQTADMSLGKSIPLLMNNIALGVTSRNFQTWPTTEFVTYTSPVYYRYLTSDIGTLKPNGNTVEVGDVGTLKYPLEILHAVGDVMLVTEPGIVQHPPTIDLLETDDDPTVFELAAPYTRFSTRTNEWVSIEEGRATLKVKSILKYASDTCKTFFTNSVPSQLQLLVAEDGTITDPNVGYLFAFINDIAGDITTPECDLGLGNTGALYRRNPAYVSFDPTSLLATDRLYEFYNAIDENIPFSTIASEFEISLSTITRLIEFRRPWIKVVTAANLLAVAEYANDHDLATVAATELSVDTYTELDEDYDYTNIPNGTWVYVVDEDRYYQASITSTVVSWIPFTEAGLMYAVIDDASDTVTKLHFLTYTEDNKLDLSGTLTWANVDRWPWELSNWIDATTGNLAPITITLSPDTSAKIKHFGGDYIVDEHGEPVYDEATADQMRLAIYYVNMLQVDYKLTQSFDSQYRNYADDVRNQLTNYFTILQAAKPRLLEQTELYYIPVQTLGDAYFRGVAGTKILAPLAISISLRLYVERYVLEDDQTKTLIRSRVIALVDKHLTTGTISSVVLAQEIKSTMADIVHFVDVLGLNDNIGSQTLIAVDSTTVPHLRQYLVVAEDGTIGVERAVNIDYVAI